ncbi:4Fe-4S double cluster binding domain-containing protein [Crassaminicella profunda]|uniref:4Fe-4S double cluster binding domain-containing protein n=1 Tax=Crassaminicella profunda TaxID=1286698 RepID=UPI001CA73DA8|nr:4Fe-4S double cluster binding domain-containing protein [Crassaminicella profunda]QZY56247.1 epoxyqueuosine reductase [Crassaminicella profunda]
MNQTNQLKEKIKEWGVSKVGVGYVEDVLPENLKHLKTGISIAVRLSDEIISQIEEMPTHTYFHHYRTVNAFIDQVTLKISLALQDLGYLAMPIPASQSVNIDGKQYRGIFQHRTAATRAGLGWIGKNACLVTEEFGPRVRLGTVLTNMNADYDEPTERSQCGDCKKCVSSCPALALRGALWHPGIKREELVDAKACSMHMHNHYQHIGRGVVCGLCVSICPKGNKVLKR